MIFHIEYMDWYVGHILSVVYVEAKTLWYLSLCCLQEGNTAYLPWIPGSHGDCMWINSLQEGSGIITPFLRYLSRWPERKDTTSWLCSGWQLSSLLCYNFGKRNAYPKGRETDGPSPDCCGLYLWWDAWGVGSLIRCQSLDLAHQLVFVNMAASQSNQVCRALQKWCCFRPLLSLRMCRWN